MSVKNDDKKAVLAINKIVIAFLVIFVVILVIWFWFKLDIPGKLNLLIPGFNNTQSGEDANSIENKIYFVFCCFYKSNFCLNFFVKKFIANMPYFS